MTVERLNLWVFALCALIAVLVLRSGSPSERTPSTATTSTATTHLGSATAAIPGTASLMVTLDVAAFSQSVLGKALLDPERQLGQLGSLRELCGGNPMTELDELGLASFQVGGEQELGLVATGRLDAALLEACVETIVRRRGGTLSATRIGSFRSLRDRSNVGTEIALREGGPLLLGSPSAVREMIETVDGSVPDASDHPVHQRLRAVMSSRQQPPTKNTPTLLATWALERGWLERHFGEDAAASPLATVRAGALSLDTTDPVRVRALIHCEDADAAERVAGFIEDVTEHLAPELVPELAPLLAERLVVSRHGPEVRLSLSLAEGEARALVTKWWLELVLERLQLPSLAPSAAGHSPEPPPTPTPGASTPATGPP